MADSRLHDIPNLWTANTLARSSTIALPTGFDELDRAIGGWPTPTLIEFLIDEFGIGELQLLIPMIHELQRREDASAPLIVLWLNPPFEIHATALLQNQLEPKRHWVSRDLSVVDTLWATEQALRSRVCSLVIAWLGRADLKQLRRLKLAALTGTQCILFRPECEQQSPSPASARLILQPHPDGLSVNLFKLSGARPRTIALDLRQRIGVP